jgi:hypothetical protein
MWMTLTLVLHHCQLILVTEPRLHPADSRMPPDASVSYPGLGLAICVFLHTRGSSIQIALGYTAIVSASHHKGCILFHWFWEE